MRYFQSLLIRPAFEFLSQERKEEIIKGAIQEMIDEGEIIKDQEGRFCLSELKRMN